VLPLTEKGGILHYTIAWDPELAKRHQLLLSHQAMVEEIARSTLRLLKREGKQRIAFLHMEETGFNLGATYIRALTKEEGVTLVADESFAPDESDFRSLILRSKSRTPDSYLIWAVMPSIDSAIKQIRQLDARAFVTGYFDYVADVSKIQGAPYVSEMYSSEKFLKDYRNKYGSEPISKGPNAYDITNLLVGAYESSPDKKLTGPELKKQLLKVRNYPGAVGIFSIDQFGNSSYSPVVRMAKGGERMMIGVGF
jgi:ABC-type branched-subunit amino acid transport system substrate-binding protein